MGLTEMDSRMYTEDHLWLNVNEKHQLEVGITSQGDDLMGGLTYVAVEDGAVAVESMKSAMVLNPPVIGTLEPVEFDMPTGWNEDLVIGLYNDPWNVEDAKVMDREAYLKMCLGEI